MSRKVPINSNAGASKGAVTVLRGEGIGLVVSKEAGLLLLDAITVDDESTAWAETELLGVEELIRQVHVAQVDLDRWLNEGKIFAFNDGAGTVVYPLSQFAEGAPVTGLDLIRTFFASPEDAWEWLVTPNRMTGGSKPLERLKHSDVELVVAAAEGALDYA